MVIKDKPSRIVATSEDGTLGIYNPKTSEKIIAGFPLINDEVIKCAAYDYVMRI